MPENTMMVLRETRDLALTTVEEHGSMANNMLEVISLVHNALDGADVPDKDGDKSLGIVDRVKALLTKSEDSREKLVATDDLHNKALVTIEEKNLQIEQAKHCIKNQDSIIAELQRQAHALSEINGQAKEDKAKLYLEKTEAETKAAELRSENESLKDEIEKLRLERDELRDQKSEDKLERDKAQYNELKRLVADLVGSQNTFRVHDYEYKDPYLKDPWWKDQWFTQKNNKGFDIEWQSPKVEEFKFTENYLDKKNQFTFTSGAADSDKYNVKTYYN